MDLGRFCNLHTIIKKTMLGICYNCLILHLSLNLFLVNFDSCQINRNFKKLQIFQCWFLPNQFEATFSCICGKSLDLRGSCGRRQTHQA